MSSKKAQQLLAFIFWFCVLVCPIQLNAQTKPNSPLQTGEPLSKEVLIEVLQTRGLPSDELTKYLEINGVSFQLTPAVEQELRRAAFYLAPDQIAQLTTTVRNSYRPEWNLYKRFVSYKILDEISAYQTAREYLQKYPTADARRAREVKDFVDEYEKKHNIDPTLTDRVKKALVEGKAALYSKPPRYADAEHAYRQAMELDARSWEAYIGLIDALEGQNEPAQAVVVYNLFRTQHPTDPKTYRDICVSFSTAKRYQDALGACNQALALKPDYAEAYNVIGGIYVGTKQLELAVTHYIKAIELDSKAQTYRTNLGAAYNKMAKHKQAIRVCQEALGIQPDDAEAYNCIGEAYVEWDSLHGPRSSHARKAFEQAVAKDPSVAKYQVNLADAYRADKQYREAIEPYRNAIAIDNTLTRAHYGLCRTYLDLCMMSEATQEYKILATLDTVIALDLLKQIMGKNCSK